MDTFFTFLRRGLVATVFVVFGFVVTYVPVPYTNISTAEAQLATECINCFSEVIPGAALAGIESIVAAEGAREARELPGGLNGLAWMAAKVALQLIVKDMLDWINNGFDGRPGFVEDIGSYMLEVGDVAVGTYIKELSSIGSFICDPFKLDISIALSSIYQYTRDDSEPACTLTGVIDNLEGFLSGTQGSFSQGGWDDWFDVTSNPQLYTPLGQLIKSKQGLDTRLVNARGEELELLRGSSNFLSMKNCEEVTENGVEKDICTIFTPGKTIQEKLTFTINGVEDSLIAADTVNEVLGALFGALVTKIFSEGKGLLQ
ncbi:hypothetical protein H6785_02675 [Candidatus Nomurabacteria bacterium]|nr:hypothetical protein [Candidatus Kaiserbacteria bacterium]MCB9815454.1 hypothetical protein [Candidatus Nomurabacteria bacterium]